MKLSRLSLVAGSVCLLGLAWPSFAATMPTPAAAARGVYVNGKVYRVLRTGGTLSMQISTPQFPDTPYAGNAVVLTTGLPANPVPSTYSLSCQHGNHAYGGSTAVFNNRIYYAYTNQYSCYNNIGVYVATFDPYAAGGGSWVENRLLGWYGTSAATGAAIAVLNGRLYLFSGFATHSSSNPEEGWSSHARIASPGYQPLDAVTIFKPDNPARVLVIFGKQTTDINAGYYTELGYAVWDGTFSTAVLPAAISPAGSLFNGEASIQIGTAYRASALGFPGFTGVKSPAAQLLALQLPATNVWDRGSISHWEYDIVAGTWRRDTFNVVADSAADFWTFPWYDNRCDPDSPGTQGMRQFTVLKYLIMSSASEGSPGNYGFDSDFLVPQNRINPITCTDTGGTNTPTGSMAVDIARHYWTLVGVILGSPPFSTNHLPKTAELTAQELSNLDYASTTEHGLSHSQEWGKQYSMSAGFEVSAGFFGVGEVSNSFDVGFKHAQDNRVESESTGTVTFSQKMGTNTFRTDAAPPGDVNLGLGKRGWALFNAPTIKVQDFALYSYDYDYRTGAGGVYLNQDLTMISGAADKSTMKLYAFDLKDPSKGDIEGLMAGMPGVMYHPDTGVSGFPLSTDLAAWSALEWESNTSPWEVKLGRGNYTDAVIPAMGFGEGHTPSTTFTKTQKDVSSRGETTSLDISNTTSVSLQMGEIGMKASLKVGAESSFKTSTADTTAFTTDVTASIKMGPCGVEVVDRTNCIKLLEVQPFVLKATDHTAPWIPATFQGQRPWAIAWTVDKADRDLAAPPEALAATGEGTAAAAVTPGPGFGRSLPPLNATGRIVGGRGGDDDDPLSHYSLRQGRLSWVDSRGSETRIPLTADTFNPARGVWFQIGGFSWSSIGAAGEWSRAGHSWTFNSGGQVQRNRVMLSLDFRQATFDLQIAKVDFQGSVRAGVGEVPMSIGINGLYTFRTVLRHDFDVTWRLVQPAGDRTRMQVRSFDGRFNSATRSGKMSLTGTLPDVLPTFGDLTLKMNDRKLLIPLLSMDGFRQAYESNGAFNYVKEGLNLSLNFGAKTWSATLNNQAFEKLLALRWGGSRIQFNVGGVPWYQKDHAVVDFTANLTLHTK